MTSDQAAVLELASRYLRTLSAVERAHSLDETDAVEDILGAVDPIELRLCADAVYALAAVAQVLPDRGGTVSHAASPLSLRVTADANHDGGSRPSAPSNVISLERWSVRCS